MSGRARGSLAGLAVLALLLATRLLPVGEWLRAFEGQVGRLGAWGAVLYGAVYTLAALLLVPGSVLTVGAGLLFGVVRGTVIVSLASTTAAALAFLLARHALRGRVERLARAHPRFAAVDRAVREKGWTVVALLRLSPVVPFNLSNYLYGLTAVAFGPYVLASWLAMLPGTIVYVWLGAAGRALAGGRSSGRSPAEWVLFGLGLLATAAVSLLVARAARRELARSRGITEA